MAKDGNGTTRWIAGVLLAIVIVVLGAHLGDAGDMRDMVVEGARADARQDATILAISATNQRIEAKVDRILERLSRK